jgi:hypothetical protein
MNGPRSSKQRGPQDPQFTFRNADFPAHRERCTDWKCFYLAWNDQPIQMHGCPGSSLPGKKVRSLGSFMVKTEIVPIPNIWVYYGPCRKQPTNPFIFSLKHFTPSRIVLNPCPWFGRPFFISKILVKCLLIKKVLKTILFCVGFGRTLASESTCQLEMQLTKCSVFLQR